MIAQAAWQPIAAHASASASTPPAPVGSDIAKARTVGGAEVGMRIARVASIARRGSERDHMKLVLPPENAFF
ncbi:MAG: hypothetical protein OHK0044_24120 [Burkholderiaceae bacterium]